MNRRLLHRESEVEDESDQWGHLAVRGAARPSCWRGRREEEIRGREDILHPELTERHRVVLIWRAT